MITCMPNHCLVGLTRTPLETPMMTMGTRATVKAVKSLIMLSIITIVMIIIFIMITITWDGGSEENPDDDEYPSVVAKAVLAVCFDPSRTVDINMILMMMTGMILMPIFVCL